MCVPAPCAAPAGSAATAASATYSSSAAAEHTWLLDTLEQQGDTHTIAVFTACCPCLCLVSLLPFDRLPADVLMRQFMLPVLQAPAAKPASAAELDASSASPLQRMLSLASSFMFDQMKLAIPSMIVWLTGFYAIFVSDVTSIDVSSVL